MEISCTTCGTEFGGRETTEAGVLLFVPADTGIGLYIAHGKCLGCNTPFHWSTPQTPAEIAELIKSLEKKLSRALDKLANSV